MLVGRVPSRGAVLAFPSECEISGLRGGPAGERHKRANGCLLAGVGVGLCPGYPFSPSCGDARPIARPVLQRGARRFSKERMLMILMITGVGWSFARAGTWILAMLRPALGFDWGGLMMNGSLPASRGRASDKSATVCGVTPATHGFTHRSCSFRKSMLGS